MQDARSRTAIPGNYQAAQAKRQCCHDWAKSTTIHVQAFDGDRKDDDVLAEEHRVEQSLFQSSNQASMTVNRATAQHATTHTHATSSLPRKHFKRKRGFEPFPGYFDLN